MSLDRIAGVSISHVLNKKLDYVHKSGGSNYRRSNQRYQFVLHNSAALIGRNFVPDATLFTEKPWHTWITDDIPEESMTEVDDYRHNSTNGCKNADHQFTRGLEAVGRHGYQIYNFTHLRLEFKQEPAGRNAYETTDVESLAADEYKED